VSWHTHVAAALFRPVSFVPSLIVNVVSAVAEVAMDIIASANNTKRERRGFAAAIERKRRHANATDCTMASPLPD
jgi:hypothetical protein